MKGKAVAKALSQGVASMVVGGVVAAVALGLVACGTQNNPDTRAVPDQPRTPDLPRLERRLVDLPPTEAAPVVSFSKQVLPIFAATCAGGSCHTGASPIAPDLNPSQAYAAMVNVASGQCPQLMQVKPGDAAQSYLIIKAEGAGSCFKGQKMPPSGLQASEISTLRAWITAGALNN